MNRILALPSRVLLLSVLGCASTVGAAEPEPAGSDPALISVDGAAQDTSATRDNPATNPSRSGTRFVEEIIVTAQKREENLQDVPISINAFSAETLDARGIVDPKDLPQATPGLTVGQAAGYSVTYLRGVGSDAFLLADPSVALYIDGVYFPFAHGQAQNFGAIERIEVLKGPQGTLFGRNAVGGAISVVTQAPQFDAASGSVQVSYGRFQDAQTKAQINIPLSDRFAFSLSGIYNNADNYTGGISAGKPLPTEVTKGARLKLRWAPTDDLDFSLAGFRLEQTGVSTMFAPNASPIGAFRLLIEPHRGLGGEVDDLAYLSIENTVFYGQGTLSTDWFDAKLIGSDQFIQTDARYDFDGSTQPLVFFGVPKQGADIQTAELQILSNDSSWAADRLKWILGYYFYAGDSGLDRVNFGVASSVFGGVNGLLERNALLGPVLDLLNLSQLAPGTLLAANGKLRTDSNSVFAQGTYTFSDWFSMTLGARLQEEKRELLNSGGAITLPGTGGEALGSTLVPYTQFSGQTDTTRSLSPKVSLEFRPWDEGLVYAAVQQAVKSSTYNVVNFLRFTEPEPVKKEELTAYEIGFKKTLFGGTTSLSSALFFYDITNIQVQFISLLAGGAVTFENAPGAEVKGADFDLVSEPFPDALPGFVITAGGAYLDATFTDYKDGQGFNEDTGLYSRGNDYTGKHIPRSPEFSGTFGLSQTLELAGGPLEIAADYYYNSGFFYLAQNTAFNEEKAYGVLGARLSYLYQPWQLRVTVFGRNLTDERYSYGRFTGDFGGLEAIAPPVTYGMRLNWEF